MVLYYAIINKFLDIYLFLGFIPYLEKRNPKIPAIMERTSVLTIVDCPINK
jgi:hypothetical protein